MVLHNNQVGQSLRFSGIPLVESIPVSYINYININISLKLVCPS